jgi:hypothetical protein
MGWWWGEEFANGCLCGVALERKLPAGGEGYYDFTLKAEVYFEFIFHFGCPDVLVMLGR